jgi:hypothetical protein
MTDVPSSYRHATFGVWPCPTIEGAFAMPSSLRIRALFSARASRGGRHRPARSPRPRQGRRFTSITVVVALTGALLVFQGQAATAASTGTLTKSGKDLTTGSTTAVSGGDTVQYTFHVVNTGNVTLHDVAITDMQQAPAGKLISGPSCPATKLAPGAHIDCTATYRVTQADIDHTRIDDRATVSADPPTGDPVTARASATVHVRHRGPLAYTGVPAAAEIAAALTVLGLGLLFLLAGARRRRP